MNLNGEKIQKYYKLFNVSFCVLCHRPIFNEVKRKCYNCSFSFEKMKSYNYFKKKIK